ncbi:TPA: HEPN domain-containing protein, partial [archaeon]|nr:HEPN domain-containing protein [Candidatus Naiadarchaeales archaeon SRR2090153.bin1042]
KSAKILFQSQLYENSTSEAYYCMYNSLLALLFKIGIKSENHSASIILFDMLFENKELVKIISWAKEERIDKQYYVETQQIVKVTKESCNEMILKAEDFLVKMKLLISELSNEKINSIRDNFVKLVN